MEGRPGDQRHHGRRGPPPPPVPRHPRRRHPPRRRAPHPPRTAGGRGLGHLLRRTRRGLRHRRGLCRPAARRGPARGPAHGPRLRMGARPRRYRRSPGLHPDLAGPLRLVALGGPARTAPRAALPAEVVPAQHLRLRLLGTADDRAAHRGFREAPGPPRALPAGRAAHRPGPAQPAPAARPGHRLGRDLPTARQGAARLPPDRPARAARDRHERGRAVDHRAPGERRLLGRHPAPRRLLGHRPPPPRLRPRPPGHARGPGVPGPLRGLAGGRPSGARRAGRCSHPHDRGLPVAGLGHLSRRHRARRRGAPARPSGPGQGRRLDARRGDHPDRGLGGAASRAAPGRLGLRVPQRQLPRHRRHRRGGPRPAPGQAPRPGAGGRGGGPGHPLDPRHAVAQRRLGRLRRRQHQPLPQQAPLLRLR
ncbi:hypothetical protein SNARM312S_07097 [Streptomyces narbonensis]